MGKMGGVKRERAKKHMERESSIEEKERKEKDT